MDSGRLELEARRIICPFNGIDSAGIVKVTAGCIDQVVPTEGTVHPISGDLLLPGLVDLHCHIAPDQSVYGVAPDWILRSGTQRQHHKVMQGLRRLSSLRRCLRRIR